MYAHRRHLLVFFAMSASLCVAESEGHAHGDGGEPCGCAQFEADHPFTIDCSNKPYINAAIARLEALGTPSEALCKAGDADGVMTHQVDFFIMQAHHDYCDHDTLPTGAEKIFHDWEAHCLNCVIKRNYDPTLSDCVVPTCSNSGPIDTAHVTLTEKCEAASGGHDHAHRRLWAQKQRARRLEDDGHGHGGGGDPWEWEGTFATAGVDSLTLRLQKVGDEGAEAYPDDFITILVGDIPAEEVAEGRAGFIHMHTDGANPDANFPGHGSNNTADANGACTPLTSDGTIELGTCYTLTLNQALDESTYKINVAAVDNIILYAEHLPIEFEQTAHYLYNTANGEDVEPIEQKPDPAGRCCDSFMTLPGATAEQKNAVTGAFGSIVAYHDLCGHDDLPSYVEKDFHDYEESCENYFCNAVGPDVDQLACPSPPAPAAEKHGLIELHGAGTTNPSKLFWQVADLLEERARVSLHITYRAVGSSTGQREFLGCYNALDADSMCLPEGGGALFPPVRMNDFGAGDIPMSAGRYADVAKLGRKVVHVPFAVGGIGVFHSVPEGMLGGKPLHLTGCVLAKIFSAQITKWDDPEIVALNPDSTATAAIKVVHRKKGSSSTSGFTEYMARKCPAEWTEKGWQAKSTIVWPSGTAEAQGSGGMSAYIQENEYAIGYIDAGHGHDKGLSEIALMNKDGNYLTTKQADIGAAATVALAPGSNLIPADPSADFSGVNLYDMSGPDTWPITMISYFYLDPDMTAMDPDTAAILLFFVNFVIGAEGQAIASNKYNMFVPLPKALQDYNAKTLADHVTPPAGMVPFQEELASNTLILTGAQDHYISGKRRSYAELERERTVKALEALQAEEAAHEADESHENGHANGAVNATTTIALPWVGEQEITTIAQAGLGLGVVGFVFGFIALIVAIGACMTKTQKPRSQEIPVRNLDVPKSAV